MPKSKFVKTLQDADVFFNEYEEYEELPAAKKKNRENIKTPKKKPKEYLKKKFLE